MLLLNKFRGGGGVDVQTLPSRSTLGSDYKVSQTMHGTWWERVGIHKEKLGVGSKWYLRYLGTPCSAMTLKP